MEDQKNPSCAPKKKQVVVNISKLSTHGGGGGIGGLILLGGVLATAAIASAFVFGKKRRGGSGDNRPPAMNKEDEREKEQFTSLDADKHSSHEIIKEVEFKNDSQSFVLYEKRKIEITEVAVCDSETSEQILFSITPNRPENGVISHGGVTHLTAGEQTTQSQHEIENTEVNDAKNQSPDEEATDENGIMKECKDFEEVEAEGDDRLDREMHDVKCENSEESYGNYVPEIGLEFGEGALVPEHNKDLQEISLLLVGSPISKHENKKQDYLCSEVVEITGETIQQDEDQLEHTEEHLVQPCEICDEPDEDNIRHKCEQGKEDQLCEEKGYINHSTPESRHLGVSGEEDVHVLAMHLPEDEPISPEEVEVPQDDAVNGEIEVSSCQQKDTEDEVEENIEIEVENSSEAIDSDIATVKNEEVSIDGTDDGLSDETKQDTEGSVDSSMESNLGGVWPAEEIQEPYTETQQEKLVNQEMEGKFQEDTIVKRGINEFHPYKIISKTTQSTNGIERHVANLATLKDHKTNSNARKVLLVAITVLSSVSCSLFFGLSFDKFCFVVLLTILLSKSMIVK